MPASEAVDAVLLETAGHAIEVGPGFCLSDASVVQAAGNGLDPVPSTLVDARREDHKDSLCEYFAMTLKLQTRPLPPSPPPTTCFRG